jgi:hypothetical protein
MRRRQLQFGTVIALLSLASAYAVAQAVTGSGSTIIGSDRPKKAVAPDSPITIHGRTVVDGAEWMVKTYHNVDGQLCVVQTVPGEGEGGTCLEESTLFARGPILLFSGSRQNEGNTQTWDNAWVWGFVSPSVTNLDLVSTNCTKIPLHVDSQGVFLHVVASGPLHRGDWPYKIVAEGLAGEIIASEVVKLRDPSTSVLGGTSTPSKECT